MRIISKKALVTFWKERPEAKVSLSIWHKIVAGSTWEDFAETRKTFRSADIYRDCVIFNIGGNKYRVIAKVRYRTKRVYIRFVMTHSEYNNGSWKKDCEC